MGAHRAHFGGPLLPGPASRTRPLSEGRPRPSCPPGLGPHRWPALRTTQGAPRRLPGKGERERKAAHGPPYHLCNLIWLQSPFLTPLSIKPGRPGHQTGRSERGPLGRDLRQVCLGRCNHPPRGLSPCLRGAGGVTVALANVLSREIFMTGFQAAALPRGACPRARAGATGREHRGPGRAQGHTGAGHRAGVSGFSGPEPREHRQGDGWPARQPLTCRRCP